MTLKNISLTKISFAISLLGILILIFLANTIQPKIINIAEINSFHLNQQVKIQGQIILIKDFGQYKFQLITLKDSSGEIDAVVKYKNYPPPLSANQEIILLGRVIQYKEAYQIQTEKIFMKE